MTRGRSSPIIFGTDGWRDRIADRFTIAGVREATQALLRFLSKDRRPILVGYDRRFLSDRFARAAAEVCAASGRTALLADTVVPTPAVSVEVPRLKAACGIIITASHNPALYNGFKIKDFLGRSAPPEWTAGVEKNLGKRSRPGRGAIRSISLLPAYLTHLQRLVSFKTLRRFPKPVVFDYMHGATAEMHPLLTRSMPRLIPLHERHDPLFGGLHPEPILPYLQELQKAVLRSKAALGIATDGDGDRLGLVDDRGRYLTPHQTFSLLVWHLCENQKKRGKVVQSVSMGYLSKRVAKHYGCPFEEVPVGFKHIAERMIQGNVLIGGEESGGYGIAGGPPERDGLLSGLLIWEMVASLGKPLSVILDQVERQFGASRYLRTDFLLNRMMRDKAEFAKKISAVMPDTLLGMPIQRLRTDDGVKIFMEEGWLLLRPSGTEPLLRTYAETPRAGLTQKLLQEGRKIVRNAALLA